MFRIVLVLLAALAASGCATGPAAIAKYPAYNTVSIAVSAGVDRDSALVGDHYIPESQVYIAGFTGGQNAVGPLGIIGLAIGTGIDEGRAFSAVGDARQALTVKFDGAVAKSLRKRTENWKGPVVQMAAVNDRAARIVVMPRARVFPIGAGDASVSFRLDVFYAEPESFGRPEKRLEYNYYPGVSRPLAGPGGWSDRDGDVFREVAAVAVDRLVEVFLVDLAGGLRRDSENLRPVKWAPPVSTEPQSAMVVYEEGDYVVAFPVFKDRTFRNGTLVLDRKALR